MAYAFSNETLEHIAMLYLQNQDLSGKTPTEIYSMYMAALKELHNAAYSWDD